MAVGLVDVDKEGDDGQLTYLIVLTTDLVIAMHRLPRLHGYMP